MTGLCLGRHRVISVVIDYRCKHSADAVAIFERRNKIVVIKAIIDTITKPPIEVTSRYEMSVADVPKLAPRKVPYAPTSISPA